MAINRKPCAICNGLMEEGALSLLRGEEGACHMTLSNVPIMLCPEEHKRLLYMSFVSELMDMLARPETAGIRVGESRGIFRKRYRCTKCSHNIEGDQIAIREFKAQVILDEMTRPMSVVLRMPAMRCGKCTNEQLADDNELMRVFRALTAAFRSADVRPK